MSRPNSHDDVCAAIRPIRIAVQVVACWSDRKWCASLKWLDRKLTASPTLLPRWPAVVPLGPTHGRCGHLSAVVSLGQARVRRVGLLMRGMSPASASAALPATATAETGGTARSLEGWPEYRL